MYKLSYERTVHVLRLVPILLFFFCSSVEKHITSIFLDASSPVPTRSPECQQKMWKSGHREVCERHMRLLGNLQAVDEALAELWEGTEDGGTGDADADARVKGTRRLHEPAASEVPPPHALVGQRVVIVGTKRADLNGRRGQVMQRELYGYTNVGTYFQMPSDAL